ncbi:MAG TPA: tetratricopeptide repeat protein [Bryobacteraceae bacterium]|nr:tetratricopeptide repeat protein [Bryobacteraceae bacterium]
MRAFLLAVLLIPAAWAAHFSRADQLSTDQRIAACQKTLAAQPGDPAALEDLAAAYLQKMRETTDFSYLERAEKLVAQALARKPGDLEALVLTNEIELNRHHFAKVVENTEALVKSAPQNPRLWGMMGDALMEIGDYDRAASAYEQMLMLRPGLSSYNRVAWYRFVTGDAEGAIYAMRQAVHVASATPENLAWCLVDLGNLYFKTGRLPEAEANYNAALQTFPRYHPAFAGLGRVAAARHATAEAIAAYSRAQAIVPLPDYAGALRDLYLEQGNKVEARKQEALLDVVDRLARANFENTDRNLAIVLADEGRRLDRALELATNELAFRRDVYTYDALAWVLYRLERYPEARDAMKKALAWKTPEPSFRRHAELILGAASLP